MAERLIIKNFGPIKSIDIELRKMTVLIGPQASGKSTIAKVLSICRDIKNLNNHNYSAFIETDFYRSLVDWGLNSFWKPNSIIKYSSGYYVFSIKNSLANSVLDFKSVFDVKSEFSQEIKDSFKINEDFFKLQFIENAHENWHAPFYFPTERGLQSIFSLGKSSIQNMSDALFNQFSLLNNISRKYSTSTIIEPLDIEYKNDNGRGLTKKKGEDKFFNLNGGASGYQSVIPIVLAVKYYSEGEKRNRTYIVEEPEQNLFPAAQKKLVEFFVESDNQFILPTHSPYILSALENLMYASKIAHLDEGKYADAVEKLVPKKYWINEKDVAVYALEGGGAKDLVDSEYALIDKDYIDSVSVDINDVFERLSDIEVSHQNETTL